jgi:hypothetical protein
MDKTPDRYGSGLAVRVSTIRYVDRISFEHLHRVIEINFVRLQSDCPFYGIELDFDHLTYPRFIFKGHACRYLAPQASQLIA